MSHVLSCVDLQDPAIGGVFHAYDPAIIIKIVTVLIITSLDGEPTEHTYKKNSARHTFLVAFLCNAISTVGHGRFSGVGVWLGKYNLQRPTPALKRDESREKKPPSFVCSRVGQ